MADEEPQENIEPGSNENPEPPAEPTEAEDQEAIEPGSEAQILALRAELDELRAATDTKISELAEALTTATTERDQANEHREGLQAEVVALQSRELAAVRARILAQSSDVVPELVAGDTVEALEASVTTAQAAYNAILEKARQQAATHVPTGASGTAPPPAESLSPLEKITNALNRQDGRR